MNRDAVDIAWVVAEVVRRLAPHLAAPATSSERPTPAAKPEPDVHELSSRLITLAALPDNLTGVKRLRVPLQAVVTPAVKDELRKRGIELERQNVSDEASAAPGGLEVVLSTEDANAAKIARTLSQLVDATSSVQSDLTHAVQYVTAAVCDPHRAAILLTDQPLAAVCLANRQDAVRAAAGTSAAEAKQAVAAIGANLLVVDPRQVSWLEWKNIVRQFQAGLPRKCPAELEPR